jgi:hypothetical protein
MQQRRTSGRDPDKTETLLGEAADGTGSGFDPAALPLPSISRRRLAQAAGLIVAVWLVIGFGRQVADASAASNRADDLRAQNAALREQVGALQDDLGRVQDGGYIQLQGRAYGLGGAKEIPFTLEAGAPTPGPNAPGAAAVRLGAEPERSSPLDGWLESLFGPQR